MTAPKWWKEAIGYQIWPASYKDSNGDGFGDIPGIISTLDYIRDLGVDFIWLSPMYDSPQHDWGYDISNYEAVWPKYGTIQDMDTLITECHARGIKLLLDLVVNHTSDEHAWFRESASSCTNPKADWYIWRDPKFVDGKRCPPNNWRSQFGGPAWTYVPARDQYYLHICLSQQPDLNWENQITREAIYESSMRFWLRKGVDGFRVDIVNCYSKDQTFRDTPVVEPGQPTQPMEGSLFRNGPRMHEWLREQRHLAFDPFGQDVVLVGELTGTGAEETLLYTSSKHRELDMIFDFDFSMSGSGPNLSHHQWGPAKLTDFKAGFAKAQGFLLDRDMDAWTTVFAENHDSPRSVSKYGNDSPEFWAKSAKLLSMLLCSLSGTLFLYQGQEFGMTSLPKAYPLEDMRDGPWINYIQSALAEKPGDEEHIKKVQHAFWNMGRDNNRTPVQWDDSLPSAGFSTTEPWIKVNESFTKINAKSQIGIEGSVLEFWKKIIAMRKSEEWKQVFVYGDFELVDPENQKTFTFWKRTATRKALVVLNLSEEEQNISRPPDFNLDNARVLVSNYPDSSGAENHVLKPWEGKIYIVE